MIEVAVSYGDDDIAQTYRFESSFVLIGRSPDCDLSLTDPHISSRHAYLQRIFGRVVCVDLASSNGIQWPDGHKPFGWFDEQHPIRIGEYHLRLLSPSQQEDIAEPEFDPAAFFKSAHDEPDCPRVSLQFLSDSNAGESWVLSRNITLVGSSDCCKLRLSHSSVSRVHCSLILLPEGLWLVDLLGNEGTLVNDRPVRSARLETGDVFQVGKYSFRVKYLFDENSDAASARLVQDNSLAGKVVSNEFASQMIEQMVSMQQQFMQHSQQQTEMMLQFFSTLHTQQHELLAREMSRVHEIDKELHELRRALLNSKAEEGTLAPSSDSPESVEEKATRSGGRKRLPHIRYAGGPIHRSVQDAVVEQPGDLEVTEHPSEPEEREKTQQQEDGSCKQQHEPGNTSESASQVEEVLADEVLDVEEVEPDDVAGDSENPEEAFATDLTSESDSEDDHESEPAAMFSQGERPAYDETDHHAWVLSRMHTLERERDGIFRRLVNRLFKSNQ